jgi:uncharacterized membrane protein YkoI
MLAGRYTALIVSLLFAVGMTSAAVSADRHPDDDAARIRMAVAHGRVIPLPRILAVAQARVPGEVLKVELEEISDRLGYEVKMLTPDGRVREIKLDARTGAILAVQDD